MDDSDEESHRRRRLLVGASIVGVLACFPKSRRIVRRCVGTLASGAGFVTNTAWDAAHGGSKKRFQWNKALQTLDEYLTKSGVGDEVTKSVSRRFLHNVGLLARLQDLLPDRGKQMRLHGDMKYYNLPTAEEAARYMRFATAVYGYSMIQSVEVELNSDARRGLTTQEEVLRHTSIPNPQDLLVSDWDYGTGMDSLRHMVAIDHANKAVVLSVRGTFDFSGVVVDLIGYTEPFCGGEAHAGIAEMARAVWRKVQESLGEMVETVPGDYELVITGHSLGAGVACLMTIMAYHEKLFPPHVKIRCLAYAPPPVFYPLEAAEEALPNITAYANSHDVVPSLSVSAFRRLFAQIAVFDEEFRHERLLKILRIRLGLAKIPQHIVDAVMDIRDKPLRKIKGAPMLAVPAHVIVWLKEGEKSTIENLCISKVACDPLKHAQSGIYLHSNMLTDHFPPMYQLALEHILANEKNGNDESLHNLPEETDSLV